MPATRDAEAQQDAGLLCRLAGDARPEARAAAATHSQAHLPQTARQLAGQHASLALLTQLKPKPAIPILTKAACQLGRQHATARCRCRRRLVLQVASLHLLLPLEHELLQGRQAAGLAA